MCVCVVDEQLKLLLLSQLKSIETCLEPDLAREVTPPVVTLGDAREGSQFETGLLNYCTRLSQREWAKSFSFNRGLHGLTILHVAAALGYHQLIQTLTHWR